MSPGARTIPAAMALPMAADIPNHMPRTLRRRLRLLAAAGAAKLLLDGERVGVEDKSDRFSNWSVSGTSRNLAIIVGMVENASEKWRAC